MHTLTIRPLNNMNGGHALTVRAAQHNEKESLNVKSLQVGRSHESKSGVRLTERRVPRDTNCARHTVIQKRQGKDANQCDLSERSCDPGHRRRTPNSSPFAVVHADWPARRLDVALTKKQVEKSPDIDTQRPISRQQEAGYLGYYGYGRYWGGPYLWGSAPVPRLSVALVPQEQELHNIQQESANSHLRSPEAVTGYYIEASDGEVGHLDGFVVDEEAWAIRYIEVATRNWWPGKKVLFSPEWIERISWQESRVYVGLTREAIKDAPNYVESMPITREYEHRLFVGYGRPPYWRPGVKSKPGVGASGV